MPGPAPSTGRDLHVDIPLSNVVVGRRPEGFIADRFIPITPVDKQSNMYYKFRHMEWRRFENGLTLRAPSTQARKVHMTVSSDNYFAPNYALGTDWPVEDEVNADAVLSWATNQSLFLTDRLMIDYEYRLANMALTSTNVRTVTTVTSPWRKTTGTPLQDLITVRDQFRQATGMMPNRLIIPEAIMKWLRINDELRYVRFGQVVGGTITEADLAEMLGIDEVLVPFSQVNTYGETETLNGSATLSDIWGSNSIIMAKVNMLSGMMTDTWINAFRWTSPLLGVPMSVQRYPYDVKRKCYEIEVGYYQGEKVVSSDLATIVTSV